MEVSYPLDTEGIAMDEGVCGGRSRPEEGNCAEEYLISRWTLHSVVATMSRLTSGNVSRASEG